MTSVSTLMLFKVCLALAHRGSLTPNTQTGSEDQVIIISLVRTKKLGFLKSWQRTNVMLTRCKRHMYIVSSKAFLKGRGAKSLVGKMAIELGKQPGVWLTQQNLEDGKFD